MRWGTQSAAEFTRPQGHSLTLFTPNVLCCEKRESKSCTWKMVGLEKKNNWAIKYKNLISQVGVIINLKTNSLIGLRLTWETDFHKAINETGQNKTRGWKWWSSKIKDSLLVFLPWPLQVRTYEDKDKQPLWLEWVEVNLFQLLVDLSLNFFLLAGNILEMSK